METREALLAEGGTGVHPSAEVDRDALMLIAFARAQEPVIVVDASLPERPVVLANSAFLRLTGLDPETVLGRSCLDLLGDGGSSGPTIRAVLIEGNTAEVEAPSRRHDGSVFWSLVRVSPVRDEAGALRYLLVSLGDAAIRRETADYREAERRLLREVNHRAMNALALVQGFVRLSRRDSIEGFAKAVERRVDVLARTHALLARTRWANVTLEQILQMELVSCPQERTHIHGPPVLVSAQRVQPLALLVHELASNATRHGALAQPEGSLDVAWAPNAEPGGVSIIWEECGARRMATDDAAGFGLKLATSIARRQLQGRMRQHWTGEGLTTHVSCRIAA